MSNANPDDGSWWWAAAKIVVVLAVTAGVIWLAIAACLIHRDTSGTSTQVTAPYNRSAADTKFLDLFQTHIAGISNTEGDAGLVKLGHLICDELNEGSPRSQTIRHFTQPKSGHSWSDSDASWLMTASVVAYCPEYILPSDRW